MRGVSLAIVLSGCSLIVDPPPEADHPEIPVNEIRTDDQANPAAVFVGGRYFIVWQDQSPESPDPDDGILSRFVSKTGELEGVDVLINKDTAGSQNHPQVATNGDGVLVVWFDEAGVAPKLAGRMVLSTGALEDPVVAISDTTLPADDHQLAALANKSFVVVWTDVNAIEDPAKPGIVGRLVDPMGQPSGGELLDIVETRDGNQSEPHVARGTDNVLGVWKQDTGDGGDIHGRFLSASGAPIGAELELNMITTGIQSQPYALALPMGNYLVAWTDGSAAGSDDVDGTAIRGRFINSTNMGSGEIVLNERTVGNQGHPRVVQLPDGTFVVTFEDASGLLPDTDGNGIRRRRIGADRVPLGEDQVNTFYKEEQEDATVVLDDAGGYMVVWEDGGGSPPDNSGDGIRARLYSAAD